MKHKRCLLASLAVFITFAVLEMIIHGNCLKDIYQETASLWRTEEEMKNLFWLMWLGYLIFSFFFVMIYKKGYEEGKSGLGQGFRYGLLVALMLAPMMALGWYVVLPIPPVLAVYWFVAAFVEYIFMGLVVGLIWKNEA